MVNPDGRLENVWLLFAQTSQALLTERRQEQQNVMAKIVGDELKCPRDEYAFPQTLKDPYILKAFLKAIREHPQIGRIWVSR